MKQIVLIVAGACVLGVLWLTVLSPREDSGSRGPDARPDSSDARSPNAFTREGEGAPLASDAGSGPGGSEPAAGYDRGEDRGYDPTPLDNEREEAMSRSSSSERYEAIKRRIEREHAAGRGADSEASRAERDDPSQGDEGHDDGRPSHEAVQQQAAELALQLQLIPTEQLELRVENAVPEGSLPPEEMGPARDAARERLLAEELILDYLSELSAHEGASAAELRRRRDLGQTLLSGQDQEYIDQMTAEALRARGSAP